MDRERNAEYLNGWEAFCASLEYDGDRGPDWRCGYRAAEKEYIEACQELHDCPP